MPEKLLTDIRIHDPDPERGINTDPAATAERATRITANQKIHERNSMLHPVDTVAPAPPDRAVRSSRNGTTNPPHHTPPPLAPVIHSFPANNTIFTHGGE